MVGDEVAKLGRDSAVSTEREIGFDAMLQNCEPFLLQALDVRTCEWLICEIRQRRSAPKIECVAQQLRCPLNGVLVQRCSTRSYESRKSMEIELLRLNLQDVPVTLRLDPRSVAEKLAEI
jgi:hypothetical protein